MKPFSFIALLICPLIAVSQPAEVQKNNKDGAEEVRADFNRYRTATFEDRGADAIKYLDERVFDYYELMLGHARRSDSATVAGLELADQLVVLAIRHRATPEQVMGFTDSTCLIFALDEGMIDKEGAANIQIDDVRIDGDFAEATVSSRGEQLPVQFHFYRTDGVWKFDLTQLFPLANEVMTAIVEDSGMEAGELMIMLIGMASGKTVDESSIWMPIE
ncbi:MAG: hypothetical protein AAGF87_12275 [Bacteroidota bacterium]